MMPQVLTANRLSVGEVVYWNAAKGWVTYLHEAEILPDDKAEDRPQERRRAFGSGTPSRQRLSVRGARQRRRHRAR